MYSFCGKNIVDTSFLCKFATPQLYVAALTAYIIYM